MKIALIYELYFPARGGIESWISNVANELVSRGHQVDIITSQIPEAQESEMFDGFKSQNPRIIRLDENNKMKDLYTKGQNGIDRQFYWINILRKYLNGHKNEYDIIHTQIQASTIGAVLAGCSNKLIWTWHGTYHKELYQMFPFMKALFVDIGEHVTAKLPFRYCITADNYTKELAKKHFFIDEKKFVPIANGVDIEQFKPLKKSRRSFEFNIITARRLVDKTGIQYLIQALEPIMKEDKHILLSVYGDGPMREELEQMSKDRGLQDNIFFMGFADYKDMPEIYAEADLIAVPSLIEATSLTCLEAMACRRPLLTCPVGGIPEIAPENCVVYAKPADVKSLEEALRKAIYMDKYERNKMAERAYKHVTNNFTWKHTVDKIESLYKNIKMEKDIDVISQHDKVNSEAGPFGIF